MYESDQTEEKIVSLIEGYGAYPVHTIPNRISEIKLDIVINYKWQYYA